MKEHIVVLTGAGISAESGLSTFRDSGGLWEEHSIYEVATPEAFVRNQEMVLRFYNERRQQLGEVEPNAAHRALVELEQAYRVTVITQNVDDLHERAGSSKVVHLHGELTKARSSLNPELIYEIGYDQIRPGDACELGGQLRPHIVWFGEEVPMIELAAEYVSMADQILVVGTSLQVYPAAALIHRGRYGVPLTVIDPGEPEVSGDVRLLRQRATEGVPAWVRECLASIR